MQANLDAVHKEYLKGRRRIGKSAIDTFAYWSDRMQGLLKPALKRQYWYPTRISNAALAACREAIAIQRLRRRPGGPAFRWVRPLIELGHGALPEYIGRAPAMHRLFEQGPVADNHSVGMFLSHHNFTCIITTQENKDDAQLSHDETRKLCSRLCSRTRLGLSLRRG